VVSIIADSKDYISDNFTNYAPLQTDVLSDDSESICIRIDPGRPVEKRYLNGTRVGVTDFSLYCKSASKATAINQLWDYINGLDLIKFPLTDNLSITTEPQTEPHFISKSENNEVIYAASFRTWYEYNGRQ